MKKRIMLIALTLIFIIGSMGGLSENSGDYLTVHDFGDFKMTFGSDMKCVMYEKGSEDVWFELYPGYYGDDDSFECIYCFWLPTRTILANVGLDNYANKIMQECLKARRIDDELIEVERAEILETNDSEQDGEPMYSVVVKMDIQDWNMYANYRMISTINSGTYLFCIFTTDRTKLNKYEDILNTITWVQNGDKIECSLEDFKIFFDKGTIYKTFDKANNQACFIALPNYKEDDVFHDIIVCVWEEKTYDLPKVDAQAMVKNGINKGINMVKNSGIQINGSKVSDALNLKLSDKFAIGCGSIHETNYGEIYMMQCVVSDENIGTYAFTIGTANADELSKLARTLDTIMWEK